MKQKSFCTAKETVTRLPTDWEKIFAAIARICRKLKKLNSQRINDPKKKWANEVNRKFSKEEVEKANTI
jgi:hypothetical protein